MKLRIAIVAGVCLAAGVFILPATKRSNCGRNSAALAACNCYLIVIGLWQDDHPGESFA